MSYDDLSTTKSLTSSPSSTPAVPPPPKPSPPPPAAPVAAPVPPQIQDFDALIKGDVQNFVNLGEQIGGLVAEQVCFEFWELGMPRVFADWIYSPKPSFKPSKLNAPIFSL